MRRENRVQLLDNEERGTLIATEDITGVYFILHIVEDGIVAVGDDGARL
jgi:hypothetical protein